MRQALPIQRPSLLEVLGYTVALTIGAIALELGLVVVLGSALRFVVITAGIVLHLFTG